LKILKVVEKKQKILQCRPPSLSSSVAHHYCLAAMRAATLVRACSHTSCNATMSLQRHELATLWAVAPARACSHANCNVALSLQCHELITSQVAAFTASRACSVASYSACSITNLQCCELQCL
jgi:hypothetical protein